MNVLVGLLPLIFFLIVVAWLFGSINAIRNDVERLVNKLDALEQLTRDLNRRVP